LVLKNLILEHNCSYSIFHNWSDISGLGLGLGLTLLWPR